MKYAVISDVHANPSALKTVLEDSSDYGVAKWICLGDVVGYGPDASGAIQLIRREADVCLMGNHDAAVAAVIGSDGFSLSAVQGIRRHCNETDVEERQWLAGLDFVFADGDMACVHGDFVQPKAFNYIRSVDDAIRSLNERRETVLFVGHTHKPAVFVRNSDGTVQEVGCPEALNLEDGCRYLINVGSVGYPRYELCSTYCVYDTEKKSVIFRRVPFDFDGYERALAKQDVALPSWFEGLKIEARKQRNEDVRTFWQMLKNIMR